MLVRRARGTCWMQKNGGKIIRTRLVYFHSLLSSIIPATCSSGSLPIATVLQAWLGFGFLSLHFCCFLLWECFDEVSDLHTTKRSFGLVLTV